MIALAGTLVVAVLGAAADVSLYGSDVQVTIQGIVEGREPTQAVVAPDGIRIDAGPVDALGVRQPSSGKFVRWREGHGGVLVWSLRAVLTHSGLSARFELLADGTDRREIRWGLGLDTDWTRRGAGRPVPVAGGTVVRAAVMNGDSIVFQLAMPVLDSEPAGYFHPSVRYLATINSAVPGIRRPLEPNRPIRPWRPTEMPPELEPSRGSAGRLP